MRQAIENELLSIYHLNKLDLQAREIESEKQAWHSYLDQLYAYAQANGINRETETQSVLEACSVTGGNIETLTHALELFMGTLHSRAAGVRLAIETGMSPSQIGELAREIAAKLSLPEETKEGLVSRFLDSVKSSQAGLDRRRRYEYRERKKNREIWETIGEGIGMGQEYERSTAKTDGQSYTESVEQQSSSTSNRSA